jgi:hypothetical protein
MMTSGTILPIGFGAWELLELVSAMIDHSRQEKFPRIPSSNCLASLQAGAHRSRCALRHNYSDLLVFHFFSRCLAAWATYATGQGSWCGIRRAL